jgi:hypothetical protein
VTQTKGIASNCVPGQLINGVGAEISGALGQVFLVDVHPDVGSPLIFASAAARSDQTGVASPWTLRSYRICSTPHPGGQSVTAASSAFDSVTVKSASATCPAGQRVVGAGGFVAGDGADAGEVLLQQISPDVPLQRVAVVAAEDTDFTGLAWDVTAVALCSAPPAGLQLVTANGPLAEEEFVTATARCPAGKHVLGLGGGIQPGFGFTTLDDLRPDALLTSVTVSGATTEPGLPNQQRAVAHAICASM